MIHCGDVEGMDDLIKSKVNGPCYMVMGNNDWFSNLPAEIQVNIDDYRAFITHGHNYGVSLGLEGIYAEALSRGVDIVLFGHTHRPVAEKRGNLWIVNPGSLTYPRQMGRKQAMPCWRSTKSMSFRWKSSIWIKKRVEKGRKTAQNRMNYRN
mgnify:CR=1 FL=1